MLERETQPPGAVADFEFRPGSDCIMSAVSNITRFHGLQLSDALVYGLGEGYFFWYADVAPDELPPVLIGKNVFMEHRFAENIGGSLTVHEPVTAEDLEACHRRMAAGGATIVKCDPFYFSYIEWPGDEPLHFGEHVLIVVHIEGETAYLADVFRDDIVGVPLAELRAARSSTHGPALMHPRNRWYELELPATVDDLEARVAGAVGNMLEQQLEGRGGFGLSGLERMRSEYRPRLEHYFESDQGSFVDACYAGGGRILEGHCGAFNREMLSRFLAVAAHLLRIPSLSSPVLESQAIDAWRVLGEMLMEYAMVPAGADGRAPEWAAIDGALDTAIETEKRLCHSIWDASKPFLNR